MSKARKVTVRSLRRGAVRAKRLQRTHLMANLLRHRHQLKNVAIGIFEVEAPTAIPIVELSVVNGPGGTAEGQPGSLHPQGF
jgi:hypothetical protein